MSSLLKLRAYLNKTGLLEHARTDASVDAPALDSEPRGPLGASVWPSWAESLGPMRRAALLEHLLRRTHSCHVRYHQLPRRKRRGRPPRGRRTRRRRRRARVEAALGDRATRRRPPQGPRHIDRIALAVRPTSPPSPPSRPPSAKISTASAGSPISETDTGIQEAAAASRARPSCWSPASPQAPDPRLALLPPHVIKLEDASKMDVRVRGTRPSPATPSPVLAWNLNELLFFGKNRAAQTRRDIGMDIDPATSIVLAPSRI